MWVECCHNKTQGTHYDPLFTRQQTRYLWTTLAVFSFIKFSFVKLYEHIASVGRFLHNRKSWQKTHHFCEMSTFGTFLTSGPYRRHRKKGDFHQRFLRENHKHFPKAIRPKVSVNVNPVVQCINNNRQTPETTVQQTMKYKNSSQIVPTVGLTNLIFYDCHKGKSKKRSLDDSISKIMTPLPSLATDYLNGSEVREESRSFFVPEVLMDSNQPSFDVISDPATNKSAEWMADNFDEFVSVLPQTFSDGTVQDFTLTSNTTSSFLSPVVESYASFEMDLNRVADDKNISIDVPPSQVLSFELNLDDQTDRLSDNIDERLDDGTFDRNLNRRIGHNLSTDSLSASGFGCSQLNTPDWQMQSTISHSEDESMEKFGVSSCCSDISLEMDGERDCYADFVPLLTSTPMSRRKTKTRDNANRGRIEVSGLLDEATGEMFFHQQERGNEPTTNFTFSGMSSGMSYLQFSFSSFLIIH